MKKIDVLGKKFNNLLVISEDTPLIAKDGRTILRYYCKCDCGNTCLATSQALRNEKTKSCGCLKNKPINDLAGLKIGMVTVVKYIDKKWECLCECGSVFYRDSNNISHHKNPEYFSCGCYRKPNKIRHGHSVGRKHSPTYTVWHTMLSRCNNPNYAQYSEYGGVGIKVCSRWDINNGGSFDNFLEDMGVRPEGLSLNRINGAPLYSKETCEWATLSVQAYDQKIRCTNKSGKTGVFYNKKIGKWETYIWKEYKKTNLGYYEDYDEAVKVRQAAELELYGFIKE